MERVICKAKPLYVLYLCNAREVVDNWMDVMMEIWEDESIQHLVSIEGQLQEGSLAIVAVYCCSEVKVKNLRVHLGDEATFSFSKEPIELLDECKHSARLRFYDILPYDHEE